GETSALECGPQPWARLATSHRGVAFLPVAEMSPLRVRDPPRRAGEPEAERERRLRPLGDPDAGLAEREEHVADREPNDVRVAAVVRLDERTSGALEGVRAGLVERLAGRDVRADRVLVRRSHRDVPAHPEV